MIKVNATTVARIYERQEIHNKADLEKRKAGYIDRIAEIDELLAVLA